MAAPLLAALPRHSIVLVTGANGFLASHICDHLLTYGFVPRGSVRSADKGENIKRILDSRHPDKVKSSTSFQYVVIEDMSVEGAFDAAALGCAGIIHTASDTSFGSDVERIIPLQIRGINSILETAKRTPTVRRVVVTSSSNVLTPRPGFGGTVTDKSWNHEVVTQAWNLSHFPEGVRGAIVYAAAKVCTERAAWDFMATNKAKVHFELNCILPNFNIGPLLDAESTTRTTGSWIRGIFRNPEMLDSLRTFPPQHMVDVRDVAKLHVAALAEEDVRGERLLAFSDPFSFNDLIDVLVKLDSGKTWPEKIEGQLSDRRTFAKERSLELLRRFGQDKFTSIDESVSSCVRS